MIRRGRPPVRKIEQQWVPQADRETPIPIS